MAQDLRAENARLRGQLDEMRRERDHALIAGSLFVCNVDSRRRRGGAVTRVVMYSGGITSWAVAHHLAKEYGTENLVLLFADTLAEDEDLYRFNRDAERLLGVDITVVCDGRTPQEVGIDRKHLGNTRVANCSHLLKQKPCRDWLEANTDPASTTVYVGIDWTETHRLPAIERAWAPWPVDAPLTRPPYVDKTQLLAEARDLGLVEPRLYALGFAHNNCGGACVKAGQAQWAHLLRVFPDRFASWEAHEEAMRAEHGDIAILRDRTGGVTRPLPLTVLRQRIAASAPTAALFDMDDWGGCGCMSEPAPAGSGADPGHDTTTEASGA